MPRKSKWFDNVTLYLCLPDELSLKINLLFRGTRLVIMKNQSHVVRLVSALIRTIGMGPIGWQASIFRDVSEVNNGSAECMIHAYSTVEKSWICN